MYRIVKSSQTDFQEIVDSYISSSTLFNRDISKKVTEIIDDVIDRGDEAVSEYTQNFDNFDLSKNSIRVTNEEFNNALSNVSEELVEALQLAFYRIKDYHLRQLPLDEKYQDGTKTSLGWKWLPIDSVGLYVPGGKAFYPSSVLMNAVPAIVAGVKRIAITVPTPNGVINPSLLAAAKICGIDEIYKVGGAQAVAALAYGTKSISPVNKIVGPGNAYVAEAKRQVFGKVGIDMIAGPSEIMVIADSKAKPRWVAADLLSQAEHDEDARPILITDDEELAKEVCIQTEILVEMIGKTDIATKSIQNNGIIMLVDNLHEEAVSIANNLAPEHLEIYTENPESISKHIRNAGAVFLGAYTPEALGDYIAGPSHVLPTSGSAKFSSGLGVPEFMKRTSMIKSNYDALQEIGAPCISIAHAENLDAHALSVSLRLEEE